MKKTDKKITKIILLLLTLGLFILICLGVWLGSGQLTQAKLKVIGSIPYPIALVNGQAVFADNFILRMDAAKKMGEADSGNAAIYSQLISEEKIRQIAEGRGVSVSQKEIDDEYQARAAEPGFGTDLAGYGLSPEDFKNQVIKPELLLTNLQVWFNSQRDLNPDIYAQADLIIQKIRQGQSMADVAASSTQDSAGAATGGDLGFVDPVNLLPELREPVENMKVGDISILPSRFGLHIVQKEAENGNSAHLGQIFLKNDGFEKWLYNEESKLKVWQLVKI